MTTTTAVKHPRTKHGVDLMNEGEWLVRGTPDPMHALRLIVDVIEDGLWGVSPELDHNGDRVFGDLDPAAVDSMADYLHCLLRRAQPGLYRKVHCLESSYGAGEGWGWQLGYAKERGPGVFEGVYFRS